MPKPNNRYGELSTSQQSDVDAYINAVASGRRSGRPLTGCMVQRLSTSLQTLTHIRAIMAGPSRVELSLTHRSGTNSHDFAHLLMTEGEARTRIIPALAREARQLLAALESYGVEVEPYHRPAQDDLDRAEGKDAITEA